MTLIDPKQIRTVVIPVAAGVGNAIFAVPLVRQLYRALNAPRITVIAFGRGIAGVFDSMGEVAEVKITGGGHRGFLRFIRWTRQRKPDLYLVPYPSNRWEYNVLIATNRARHTLLHGYSVGAVRTLASVVRAHRVSAVAGIHDVEQNLRLLTAFGVTPDYSEMPRFDIAPEHERESDALLRQVNIDAGEPFIAMHPGSGDTGWGLAKRWSPAKFGELCGRLCESGAPRIVLLEGPDETGLAAAVVAHLPKLARADSLILRGSLGASAAVLRRSILYVGSDSAVAHLAAAVGTPTVVLYAPTDPTSCRPLGSAHWPIVLKKSCAPCFSYPLLTPYPAVRCRRPFCVDEIAVEQVAATTMQALQSIATGEGSIARRTGSTNRADGAG